MTNDVETANCLNRHFSLIFTSEKPKSIPILEYCFSDISDIIMTEPGVLKLMAALAVQKSTEPDGTSPYILKECRESVASVFTFLLASRLAQGCYLMIGFWPVSLLHVRMGRLLIQIITERFI